MGVSSGGAIRRLWRARMLAIMRRRGTRRARGRTLKVTVSLCSRPKLSLPVDRAVRHARWTFAYAPVRTHSTAHVAAPSAVSATAHIAYQRRPFHNLVLLNHSRSKRPLSFLSSFTRAVHRLDTAAKPYSDTPTQTGEWHIKTRGRRCKLACNTYIVHFFLGLGWAGAILQKFWEVMIFCSGVLDEHVTAGVEYAIDE